MSKLKLKNGPNTCRQITSLGSFTKFKIHESIDGKTAPSLVFMEIKKIEKMHQRNIKNEEWTCALETTLRN